MCKKQEEEVQQWFYQIDDTETWDISEPCDSKEQAIQYGIETIKEDHEKNYDDQEYMNHESFEVGRIKYYKPDCAVFDIEDIEERIIDQVYTIGNGEYIFDAFAKATFEQRQALKQKLADALNEWLKENKLEASFGEIVDQETIITGLKDIREDE